MARRYVPPAGTDSAFDKLANAIGNDDTNAVAAIFGGDRSKAQNWLNKVRANLASSDSLAQQVQAQAQIAVAEMLKDNGQPRRLNLAPGERGGTSARAPLAIYNKRAAGAAIDDVWESLGEFALAITREGMDSGKFASQLEQVRNASTGVPSEGGFLVPEIQRSQILQLSLEQSIVRSRAFVVPMPSLRLPIPTIDETTHADNTVFGGVQAYWTEESATLQTSEPKWGRVVLDAKKLVIYTQVPNELLADADTLDVWISQQFPNAMAWSEDLKFLTGSGTGEPLGVLNGSGKVAVTRTGSNEIVWTDVLNMVARLLPSSFNNSVWVANINCIPQLGKLSHIIENQAGSENVGGSAIWLTDGSSGAPMSILGRPLILTEKVPALGSAGDFSLIDFGHYLVGDRQQAQLKVSEEFRFRNDETAFRLIERVDGRPWVQSPLTPKEGTDTLSPYVVLGSA